MKKDKISLRVEVETALENKPMSDVNFSVKMQRFTAFLYKESTMFLFFYSIFMIPILFKFINSGMTHKNIVYGIILHVAFLPFFFIIKNVKPFSFRQKEYEEIKDRLDVLIEYRDYRSVVK